MYANVTPNIGAQEVSFYNLVDSTARQQPGMELDVVDSYWGPATIKYVRAAGTIPMGAIVTITPTLVAATGYRFDAVVCPNTANLGRQVAVAMSAMVSGNFGWVMISGTAPVASAASVAADTAFGIAAAGQAGAIANGKQLLNARVIAPATTTVAKTNCVANSGSLILNVTNSDGWFVGAYLSGTGIAAGTTVVDIDGSGNIVTLSLVTTAAVSGTVTATYNNATIFYNVVNFNAMFAQGQIT